MSTWRALPKNSSNGEFLMLYTRDFDGAIMVQIAPHQFVSIEAAKTLGLVIQ